MRYKQEKRRARTISLYSTPFLTSVLYSQQITIRRDSPTALDVGIIRSRGSRVKANPHIPADGPSFISCAFARPSLALSKSHGR